MSKMQLLDLLVPLVDAAVRINEYWRLNGEVSPADYDPEEDELFLCKTLCDLDDDFGEDFPGSLFGDIPYRD